ncbi:hypothetical protein [Phycisphaera mikurensis]|uniref:hypothetical protein n=1 Tax=Phycisphaera mikurensis TaxID=547188 RepID=UPI0017C475D9|nr:hypothetical protein [Phycisphaera mikurensis]MBB6443219.1 mannitol/fructose-specific phosphotransferase system IIA component (Ntr-type) [Phycisphaera mikurensis]
MIFARARQYAPVLSSVTLPHAWPKKVSTRATAAAQLRCSLAWKHEETMAHSVIAGV